MHMTTTKTVYKLELIYQFRIQYTVIRLYVVPIYFIFCNRYQGFITILDIMIIRKNHILPMICVLIYSSTEKYYCI